MLNVLALVLGGFLVFSGWQTYKVGNLKEKVAVLEERNGELQDANKQNSVALDRCVTTNRANEREAERQREQTEQAAIVAKMLRAQLEQRVLEVANEAEELVVQGGCPAADDPTFGDWLYRDS